MKDIKKSIREAMNKRLREASNDKWDATSQPNIYELSNFLRKSGYRLVDIVEHEGATIELIIEAIKPSYLYPEIVHDIAEQLFYAKVVEHGMLIASDLEEIMKGYNTALGVLNHLEELDLQELEVTPTEDEED